MYSNLFFAIQNTSKPISSRSMAYLTDNLPECITVNSWVNAPRLGKYRMIFHPALQRSYERNLQKLSKVLQSYGC